MVHPPSQASTRSRWLASSKQPTMLRRSPTKMRMKRRMMTRVVPVADEIAAGKRADVEGVRRVPWLDRLWACPISILEIIRTLS